MSRFHSRGFVSILLSISFLLVTISGFVLWLSHSPQTFGISKGVWKHDHIFLSLLFLVSCLFHLWFNWAVYWSYIWKPSRPRFQRKVEWALALALVALIASTGFFDNHGGSDRMLSTSLREVVRRAGKSEEQVVAILEKESISVHNPADTLLEIAKHNNVAPEKLMAILQRTVFEGTKEVTNPR